MSIQMSFLAGQGKSQIIAQSSVVSSISVSSGNVSIGFFSNGNQIEVRKNNTSIIGAWVNPSTAASEWEIRASLVSGDIPTGTLGTWLNFSTNRQWGFSSSSPGRLSCFLNFEFRRVGESTAEFTLTGNSLSLEVLEIF